MGGVEEFMAADHHRLDDLLREASVVPGEFDAVTYGRFRSGLLKHIGMEEKILLPAAARFRGGEPLPIATKLRLDHGAIAALLVPSPTAEIVAVLRSILERHNRIEEGREGLYATCDRLAGGAAADLVEQLRVAPEVPLSPCNDGPKVRPALARAIRRAGYDAEADLLLAAG